MMLIVNHQNKRQNMRTTLTIEDSTMKCLKQEAHDAGVPFKKIVNMVLETGLRNLHNKLTQGVPLQTYAMGNPATINFDKAITLASSLENEDILRKLEMGK